MHSRSPLPGIAISGKAHSGKSTLARRVEAVLYRAGWVPQTVSFAAALKADVEQRFGVKKGDPGARDLLIDWSYKRKAQEGEDIWVRLAAPAIAEARIAGRVPVIEDLRFGYEYDELERRGFYLVRLHAPYQSRARRCAAAGDDPAILLSKGEDETGLDGAPFHHTVANADGNQAALWSAAELIVARAFTRAIVTPG